MTDQSNIAEASSADAVQAAAAHAEAVEHARKAQLESAIFSNREETKQIFAQAMREVLTTGDEGTKTLLLQKIPLLCTDILTMKADMALLKELAKYILLGIGTLFLTLVGSLLLRGL